MFNHSERLRKNSFMSTRYIMKNSYQPRAVKRKFMTAAHQNGHNNYTLSGMKYIEYKLYRLMS